MLSAKYDATMPTEALALYLLTSSQQLPPGGKYSQSKRITHVVRNEALQNGRRHHWLCKNGVRSAANRPAIKKRTV
jgi:hypothetical protein